MFSVLCSHLLGTFYINTCQPDFQLPAPVTHFLRDFSWLQTPVPPVCRQARSTGKLILLKVVL